jgi:uncharacterized protein YdaU (DUF1376 family)
MHRLPTMPVGVDGYLADTAHLTLEQQGVHFRLQIYAWRSPGCCLPDDDAQFARMLGISLKRWATLKPSVMALWTLKDGTWVNDQVAREHEFVTGKIEKKRAAGRLGGRPKSLPDKDLGKASVSENGKQNESEPKPATATATNTPIVPKGTDPPSFAEFWAAYPKRDGDNPRKTAARAYAKVIRQGAKPAALMAAVKAYAAELAAKDRIGTEFVAQASTWLNQERFDRFAQGAGANGSSAPADPAAYLATLSADDWRGHLRRWKTTGGQWTLAQRTPPPDDPRTLVPAGVLAEFGILHTARPNLTLLTGTG